MKALPSGSPEDRLRMRENASTDRMIGETSVASFT
jgi:hypothetical protein